MMQWLSNAIGRMYFRLLTNNNWRWLALAGLTFVIFVTGLVLLPYAFTAPETNYARTQRELYEFAADLQRQWGTDPISVVRSSDSSFLRGLALVALGVLPLAALATGIYFFPAFWDEFSRAVGAVRTRMWDRYGQEIATKGWLTRIFAGSAPPAAAATAATTAAATASAAPGRPLTKGAFLAWEFLIDLANEFIGHRLWGR